MASETWRHHRAPAGGAQPRESVRVPFAQRAWWPYAKRIATFAFFGLVLWLVVMQARSVKWDEVLVSIRAYPLHVLLLAGTLAIASYAMYCTFDLLSRRYTRHTLGTAPVLVSTFISYAFNLNLGSLVGGLGFRYRLYSQLGLTPDVISRIFGFTMLTNWLGYMVMSGVVCLVQPIALPDEWALGRDALRVTGAVFIALGALYLVLCRFSRTRSWTVYGHELRLPSLRLALLQLVLSCITWSLIAGVLYTLLQHRVDYLTVLAVLLVSAVAGLITHVPAGIGVLEAVFVTLLVPQVPQSELLAALLVYRAVHYLIPLAQATVAYVLFELWVKRRREADMTS
jgi:glycosyltransferase 2 family protein